MQANGQVTTNGAGAGAGTGVAEEPRTKEHISYLVGQTKNPNKLRTVERLLQQPGSRVFVPQSEAGSMLFNRLMDLDIAFAACGRASWRNSTDEGLAKKQRLETDLHTLNRTLIQFTAQVAVEYEMCSLVLGSSATPVPAPAPAPLVVTCPFACIRVS